MYMYICYEYDILIDRVVKQTRSEIGDLQRGGKKKQTNKNEMKRGIGNTDIESLFPAFSVKINKLSERQYYRTFL